MTFFFLCMLGGDAERTVLVLWVAPNLAICNLFIVKKIIYQAPRSRLSSPSDGHMGGCCLLVVAVGMQYEGYCTNIGTVDPTKVCFILQCY